MKAVSKETQHLNTTFITISSHKRTLAIIHLTVGFLKLFIFGLLSVFYTAIKPFLEAKILEENGAEGTWIFHLISSAFFGIVVIAIIFSALPAIIGGFATLKNKNYGMVLLVIAGCISILSFPVGTAIGAYSIYVFVENQREEKNGKTDG